MRTNFKMRLYSYYMSYLVLITISLLSVSCSRNSVESPPDSTDTTQTKPPSDTEQIFLADPTIFYDNGTYYLYGTHAVNSGFQVYLSTDLKNWKKAANLALSEKDAYGTHGFWAPQVFKYKNMYYMAYVANSRIAIAKSSSPIGPFTQKVKKPIISPHGYNMIDPYVFFGKNGKIYMYYVRVHNGNRIYVAELKDDFSDIKPGTVTSCVNAVEHPQKWENLAGKTWTVTEGPTVLKHKGTYYLFYSANGFKSIYYAVGYAVSQSPLGPWTKYSSNPILNRDLIGINGPGHGDFFRGENGQYYYVFHTHYSQFEVNPRRTAIIKGAFILAGDSIDVMKFDKGSFRFLEYQP